MNSLYTNWKQTIKITFSYALASILLKRILNFSGDQEETKKKKSFLLSGRNSKRKNPSYVDLLLWIFLIL